MIKPTRCTNFSNLFLEQNYACFRHFLCPSSGVFYCTIILIIKPTRCTNFSNIFLVQNSKSFGQFLCPSSGVFLLYINSYNTNQLDALISQIYFWYKTLHVSDSSYVRHQEFFLPYINSYNKTN
jgi:hypothetical protein